MNAGDTAPGRSTPGRDRVYVRLYREVGSSYRAPIPLRGMDLRLLGPVEARASTAA
jgi:hypothetical protein